MMGFVYYLFHLSIFGCIRGVCSALMLQFQKASKTSHKNWNRKLKYYRILGYDSRLHFQSTSSAEYCRRNTLVLGAQNVIHKSIVAVMQSEALLLNWESPLGVLNWTWRALFSRMSLKYQPLSFWLDLPKFCPVLFGWKLLWTMVAFFL